MPGYWELKASPPELLIGIPSLGLVTIDWSLHLFSLWRPGATLLRTWKGIPIDVARDQLVRDAIKEGCSHIFFWDADVFPPSDTLNVLYQEKLPIVGGLYWSKRGHYACWSLDIAERTLVPLTDKDLPYKGPSRVDAIGMGCCLIDLRVFKNLPPPWFTWEIREPPAKEPGKWSEDISFPVDPSTKVLNAKFQWQSLSELIVGDTIVAVDETSFRNAERRFQLATVLEKVEHLLPAWRIVTEEHDIVTSGEHPWLCKIPKTCFPWIWKPTRFLRAGDFLSQAIPWTPNPAIDKEYELGYLQGIMLGDGTIGKPKPDGKPRRWTFTADLTMCDLEALQRTEGILTKFGFPCHWKRPAKNDKHPTWREQHGIYMPYKTAKFLSDLVVQPLQSRSFAQGFLAGIYDAEGYLDASSVVIANNSSSIIERILEAGRLLGLPFKKSIGSAYLMGMHLKHKFLLTTQPAISRRVGLKGSHGNLTVHSIPAKILAIEELGKRQELQCLVTSTGTFLPEGLTSHNCLKAMKLGGFPTYIHTSVRCGHEHTDVRDPEGKGMPPGETY